MDKNEIIANSPLGRGLTPEECQILADKAEIITLEKDQLLAEEGGDDAKLFLVVEGGLHVVKIISNHDEILHTLRKNELAGVLGVVRNIKRTAGLKASTESAILAISRKDFESLFETNPKLIYEVMCSIVECAYEIVSRMTASHVEMTNYIHHTHGRY